MNIYLLAQIIHYCDHDSKEVLLDIPLCKSIVMKLFKHNYQVN
jgi:hypothetical protein